jgi:hypothetical protein
MLALLMVARASALRLRQDLPPRAASAWTLAVLTGEDLWTTCVGRGEML